MLLHLNWYWIRYSNAWHSVDCCFIHTKPFQIPAAYLFDLYIIHPAVSQDVWLRLLVGFIIIHNHGIQHAVTIVHEILLLLSMKERPNAAITRLMSQTTNMAKTSRSSPMTFHMMNLYLLIKYLLVRYTHGSTVVGEILWKKGFFYLRLHLVY